MAALRIFIEINGFRMLATKTERRDVALSIARGEMTREEFAQWVNTRVHFEG
jgi:prophage maintenance system killer protein